ncbi:MAG: DUF167 domain-containing protein [Burkholderiales bacterium]
MHTQPNARMSAVAGRYGNALKIRIAAPALENKANQALLSFVSELFRVPTKSVVLIHGSQEPQNPRDPRCIDRTPHETGREIRDQTQGR